MTCPQCENGCAPDSPCECECHERDEEMVVTIENQVIEFEVDTHTPEGMLLSKTRIHVTGPSPEAAYLQFKRVLAEVKS